MDSDQPSATAKWCPFFVPTHHVIIIAWSPFLFGDPSSSINKSARKKNFFSWPLSLLLLFYGEFSEWAYAFSWIKLFQLVFYYNVAMHFSVSYFGNFSISVKKKYILYEILTWNVSFHSWYQKMEQHYLLSFRPKVAACAWSLIFSLLDVAKLVGHSSSQ